MRLTFATVAPMLAARESSQDSEQIPVTITMTNISNQPVYVCVSSDLSQILPRLTMNGKVLPLGNWKSLDVRTFRGTNLQHEPCLEP